MNPLARLCCALAALTLGAALYTNTAVTPSAYAQATPTPSPSPTPNPTAITVNSLSDAVGNDGLCTLREAITSANTNTASGAAPGECAAGGALDSVSFSVNGTILLTSALPDLTTAMALNGPGARLLTVSGNGTTRVFNVASTATVYLSGLTVSGGRATFGGGINNGGGTLTIDSCAITGNSVTGTGGGINNNGGGTLNVGNSTIAHNTTDPSGGGGGLYNSGTVVLTNTTVSTNSGGGGGGLQNVGSLTLRYSTVTGNSATNGGGLYNPGIGSFHFGNTIIAGNSAPNGPDCSGATIVSDDYNLIGDTAGFSPAGTTTHNVTNVSADLGPLADNGGATQTHRPLYISPAVDRGKSVNGGFGVLNDQRGLPRPLNFTEVADAAGGDGSDIGAVELQGDDQPESGHQPFVVNSEADTDDGSCDAAGAGTGNQDCTLREALNAANALAGADTVNFDPNVFAAPGPHTIELAATLPTVSTSVTVNGPGAGVLTLRRSTAGFYRLLNITATPVRLSGLTLTNGRAPDGADAAGGALVNRGATTLTGVRVTGNRSGDGTSGSPSGGGGGGIYNQGTLSLVDCLVAGNTTGNGVTGSGQLGDGGGGGGIYSAGALALTNSLVNGNGTGTGPNAGGSGGGIYASGQAALTNTTVSNNTTGAGGFASSRGGGAYANGLTLTLTNSTVTGNSSQFGGDHGLAVGPSQASISVGNTVVARNGTGTQSDLTALPNWYVSRGHNIIGIAGNTGGGNAFIDGQNGDRVGTPASPFNPLLGPLGDYGGPTQTFALLPGSPAIDAGSSTGAPATDQRGVGRVGAVDIGAFESRGFQLAATAGTPQSATINTTFGVPLTATVTSAFGEPTAGGLVTFSAPASGASGTFSGSPTVSVNASGVATAPAFTANGTGGSYNVTASAGPSSATFALTNLKLDQTITFDTLSNKVFGNPDFTVSATATSNLAVSFAAAGQCTVSGTTVHLTGAGSCTVTASQAGDAAYNAAPSVQRSFNIAQAATTTAVSTSLNPAAVGQSVTFTAAVTSPAGTPTGTVQFKVDNVNLGSPVALGADGKASVSTSALAEGQHAVTAVYSGDANFTTSNGSLFNAQWALTFSGLLSFKSEGDEPNDLDFGVTMSPACTLPVTVNYTTTDGTAVAPSDYEAKSGTLTFLPGETSKHVTVRINGDTAYEETEEFYIDFSMPGGFAVARSRGIIFNDDPAGGVIEFEQSAYNVAEGGSLTVKVKRTVQTGLPVDMDYTTDDGSAPGVNVPCSATTGLALDRCDYTKALGTLHFAAGETEKTVTILIGQDSYAEGAETFQLKLSNPKGNAAVGPKSAATVTITDDSPETSGNASDDTDNFVRQQYLDFLNREPDASGFQFWKGGIEVCGADAGCREVKRIDTSAAFFLSIEFQETGYLVYRMFKTAYGDATSPNVVGTVPVVRFNEFMPDTQRIGQNVVVGAGAWQQTLEANKQAYALEFVQRPRFLAAFPLTMTAAEFVGNLDENAGGVLSADERAQLVASLGATPADPAKRAAALRQVAEHASLRQREFNRAFVLMQFYGYLRRDPDAAPDADFRGWKFWLDKLEEFGGDYRRAEMVKAFLSSLEYRQRFGPQ
ncbi:MAG: Ig-like domain repeat protein [Acidobacteria bacterium]|nr:Ig-like domain repeat protein [Acidobacteriota bacterium]